MSYEVPEELPLQRELGRSYTIHATGGSGGADIPIHIDVPMLRARQHGDDSTHSLLDSLIPELVDNMTDTLMRRLFSVTVESKRRYEEYEVIEQELNRDQEG